MIDNILRYYRNEKDILESKLNILKIKTEKLSAAREKMLEQGGLAVDDYVALAKMLAGEFPSGNGGNYGCWSGFKLHGEKYDPKKSICDNCYGNNTGVHYENCSGFYTGDGFSGPPEFYKTTGRLIFEPPCESD